MSCEVKICVFLRKKSPLSITLFTPVKRPSCQIRIEICKDQAQSVILARNNSLKLKMSLKWICFLQHLKNFRNMIELCFQTEKYILLKKEKRIMFILRCLSSVRFIFLEKPILSGCSNSINPSPASVLGPESLSCFLLMQQRWMHAGKLRP